MRLRHHISFLLSVAALISVPISSVFAQGPGSLYISSIYGGGGNTGAPAATLRNDYVQIYNPTGSGISLSGLSLQYAAATNTGNFSSVFTFGVATIPSNRYFLVQFGSGGAAGTTFSSDASTTTNISATAGKLALINGTTAQSSTTTSAANIVDFVGYGTANAGEGTTKAPAGSNTSATVRILNGSSNNLQDTNSNSADFTTAAVTGGSQPLYSGTAAASLPISDANFQPVPAPPAAISLGIGGVVGLMGTGLRNLRGRIAKRKKAAA